MMLDLTQPHIAWHNLLKNAPSYTIQAGTESIAAPLSNAWNGMISSVALLTADASGTFRAQINIVGGNVPYGSQPYGTGPYGGIDVATALIVGASRHQSASQHWQGGTITINGSEVFPMYTAANKSAIYPFATAQSTTTVTFEISALAANQTIMIPELFYGAPLQMPPLELGFDPENDTVDFTTFRAVSGFRYDMPHSIKWMDRPRWTGIDSNLASFINMFREGTIETMTPFWWVFSPDAQPNPIYVKHIGKTAPMPYTHSIYRKFQMQLEEVLL